MCTIKETCTDADAWKEWDLDDVDFQQLLDEPTTAQAQTRTDKAHEGFNDEAGQTWIYPSNLPLRAYQQSITQAALFKNTLVVLPTGLGKTFIAAVVMYNIYRWYPQGKVIFLAPTRPLVAQQIAACQSIMPLPNEDTVELTGKLQRHKRAELWRTKRVFFATPQVVQSDIVGNGLDAVGAFPFAAVKLLVIDEAHKAKGRFAYTQVAEAIWQRNRYFRVLALSATPGRTVDDVSEVVRNLFISHLEVRWDNSIDVMQYVHKRNMKTILVPLGEKIKKVRAQLINIIDPYERQLLDAGVLSGSCANISRNFLLFEQKRFRERSLRQSHPQQSAVNSTFSICISLYHALELLERHGLRVFLNHFEEDEEGRANFVLTLNVKLRKLVEGLRNELGPNPFDTSISNMTNGQIAAMPSDLDFGHPKFEHARSCLLKHFEQHADSRAIIFCEYRESVLMVYRLLLQHVPLLRPRCFAGHSGSGPLRALTQKQQIQIMNDFRTGKSNILVATSIGEEGIDVGEVELILCFDISNSNPTRFIQRIGRTGRKKNGNVIMLVTEGREDQLLKQVLAQKDQTNKKLLHSSVVRSVLYKDSPRLVPAELSPKCVQKIVQIAKPLAAPAETPKENVKATKVTKTRIRGKPLEKLDKGSQDLRTFFNQKQNKSVRPIDLDDNDLDVFDVDAPGPETQKALERNFNDRFEELDLSDICRKTNTQLLSVSPTQTRDPKHLKKVNKMLQSLTSLVPESRRIGDLSSQLKSEKLTDTSKFLLLKASPQFVFDICEKMQVLEALEIDTNDVSMSKEEQEVRDCYKLILSLFGSKEAMNEFLSKKESQNSDTNQDYVTAEDFLCDETDFQDCMKDVFKDLDNHLFLRDNYDYIKEEFRNTQQYQNWLNKKNGITSEEEEEVLEDGLISELDIDMELQSVTRISDEYVEPSIQDCSKNDSLPNLCPWEEFSKRTDDKVAESTPLAVRAVHKSPKKHMFEKSSTMLERLEECTEAENAIETELNAPNPNRTQLNVNMNETQLSEVDVTPDILAPLPEGHSPTPKTSSSKTLNRQQSPPLSSKSSMALQKELDFDLDMFMEPFPEEEFFTALTKVPKIEISCPATDSQKENWNQGSLESPNSAPHHSPDVFEVSSKQSTPLQPPLQRKGLTLASKLAQKCLKTPTKISCTPESPKKNHLKSPSVFDTYWQNVQRHKLKKLNSGVDATTTSAGGTPSRKETEIQRLDSDSLDSDFEVIAATQQPQYTRVMHQRKKRRLCEFVEDEVEVNETHCSSDEADDTLGHYLLDSVVVNSDESGDEQTAASRSHMQAMYLQSLKSPRQLPGAFKIPNYGPFDDHSQVFSQALDTIQPSQYIPDSFVVPEDETVVEAVDVSLCPLERAELILKRRRRERRQKALYQPVVEKKPKRKIYVISDSSEDDL